MFDYGIITLLLLEVSRLSCPHTLRPFGKAHCFGFAYPYIKYELKIQVLSAMQSMLSFSLVNKMFTVHCEFQVIKLNSKTQSLQIVEVRQCIILIGH